MRNLLVSSALSPEIKKENLQKSTVKARYNIKTLGESVQLELSIPGYDKSEIKIILDQSTLIVEGSKEDSAQTNGKIIKKDFSVQAFKNVFRLDEKLDIEAISASVTQGVLTLNIPQKPTKASQNIEVK